MSEQTLPLVNDDDEVIGEATRTQIHAEGLLHREVHVWFVTPEGEIVFQRRGKDKDTWPDLLDATVGGHVDTGMSYLEAALKETEEETGLQLIPEDLIPVTKIKMKFREPLTRTVNNAFKMEYLYKFPGKLSELRVGQGKGQGFETRPIASLATLSEVERKEFLPRMFTSEFMNVLTLIEQKYES